MISCWQSICGSAYERKVHTNYCLLACIWKKKLSEPFGPCFMKNDKASFFSSGKQTLIFSLFFRSLDFFCYFFLLGKKSKRQKKRQRFPASGSFFLVFGHFFFAKS